MFIGNKMLLNPLPFYNERKTDISMLVIHSMAHSAKEGIESLKGYELSAHYVVDYDGTVFQCVDEQKRAWHAGIGSWKGLDDINSRSIGIEVCHKSLGQSKFNKIQIKNLMLLCQDIIKRNNIRADMIVGHSDIAPTRKPDPGKAFTWERLAQNGIGLWYEDEKLSLNNPEELLQIIGYDTSNPKAAIYAFCRRFAPENIITMPVKKLIKHPYPKDNHLLNNDKILEVMKKVAYQHKMLDI